ncbi:MAG: SLOG family protein, partial [Butyricicoccaceae bacterium]
PEKMPAGMAEGTPGFNQMRSHLRIAILRTAEQGYTAFLSGMSRGFDLWAAEVVLELQDRGLDIELWAALAFHGMEEYWEPEWQTRYNTVLRRARHTFAVCDRYEPGCYTKRDAFLVQRSSRCICFFDGVPGGTEYTVSAARRAGHAVVNLADPQQVLEGFCPL